MLVFFVYVYVYWSFRLRDISPTGQFAYWTFCVLYISPTIILAVDRRSRVSTSFLLAVDWINIYGPVINSAVFRDT